MNLFVPLFLITLGWLGHYLLERYRRLLSPGVRDAFSLMIILCMFTGAMMCLQQLFS
ncbi:hypothetical protein SAMN05421823_11559 [Catalinimonas alkaloidigena]|uniref:Uncharacterized protein n=1 Tax=Catalinimonas alkaloidigena TaxID=1075417 RepID=A0A1G9U1E1_9BACT|nr:hypothetical protein [Catalinimonas alkaloidigena]SDM53860.1 hypothetical protein SAMN05421823_11559 [Catalinimonas alkaloidigena]